MSLEQDNLFGLKRYKSRSSKNSRSKSIRKCGYGRAWVPKHKSNGGKMVPGMCRKKVVSKRRSRKAKSHSRKSGKKSRKSGKKSSRSRKSKSGKKSRRSRKSKSGKKSRKSKTPKHLGAKKHSMKKHSMKKHSAKRHGMKSHRRM